MGESTDPTHLIGALDGLRRRPFLGVLVMVVIVLGLLATGSGYSRTLVTNGLAIWHSFEHPARESRPTPDPPLAGAPTQVKEAKPEQSATGRVYPDRSPKPQARPADQLPPSASAAEVQGAPEPAPIRDAAAVPSGRTFAWHANQGLLSGNMIIGFDHIDVGGAGSAASNNTFIAPGQPDTADRVRLFQRRPVLGMIFSDYQQAHPEAGQAAVPPESYVNGELEKLKQPWRVRYLNKEQFAFVELNPAPQKTEAPH